MTLPDDPHAPTLQDLARAAGIALQWRDYTGRDRTISDLALGRVLHAMDLPAATARDRIDSLQRLREESGGRLPMVTAEAGVPVSLPADAQGRYRLELEDGRASEGSLDGPAATLPPIDRPGYHRLWVGTHAPLTLAVAPRHCLSMSDLGARRRRWGVTVQVPCLRRRGDGGIGDFGGVAQLVPALARHGADAIGLSPAHAAFGAWPDRFAPYSPSSRLMRNPLLADPRAVFDDRTVDGVIALRDLAETFAALERAPRIDPGAAARAKTSLFRGLFACLDASGHRTAFDAWRASQGPLVRLHAVFEALHARFSGGDAPVAHWRDWPGEFRDPWSPLVERFAAEHTAEVEFGEFLQWLAECSIGAAQGAARHAGMAIGLIADLAVGTDSAGSHAWSRQQDLLLGLRIGAPPDPLNVKGQDWGLSALSPRTLRREGFRPFIELLRANLANVGGLRIDHVFGLQRLWLIPDGADASEGAYVGYPLTDLLRLLALESWRHGALIVGEDLGTMPEGFQSRLIDAHLMGMRVMWFQRDGGYFVEPARWPEATVAMTSTHDLPTVAGWWSGRDLEWRARLDLLEPGQTEAQARTARAEDRRALWDAFIHAQVVERDAPAPPETQAEEVARAAASFIGRTPCSLALLPIEDALALPEQPNIPGTIDEHPNWRCRLPGEAGALLDGAVPEAVLSALQRARRRTGLMHARRKAPELQATPRATARVQLHAGFTFDDARAQLGYLERLGISHLFVSPILTARTGSMHGYDVVDHAGVNPELGGEAGLRRLVGELRARGMGLVVDVVPNHMAVGRADNARWLDVLEWGRDSRNATFFDIDWDRPDPALSQRVLAPFLGEPYGEALEQGRLRLSFDDAVGRFAVVYADHVFPLKPSLYRLLLGGVPALAARLDTALRTRGEARDASFAAARAELAQAHAADAAVREAVARALSRFDPAQPGGRALLHRLMDRQHWRLAWWRTAADEINWRRFFDVTDLCAIRMEDRAVFEIVHGTLLRLYAEGLVDGLRIDHVDGLADPRAYCRHLRARLRRERPGHAAWVVVEKILAPGERLASDWQTDGTSGYTFMNEVGALLHDPRGQERLSRFWHRQEGAGDFSEEEERARRRIPRELFGAEFEACAHALHAVARQSPATRDWTIAAIRRVLTELIAHFPVYRTYADGRGRGEEDRRLMARAVQAAEPGCRPAERPLLHRVDAWLGGEAPKDLRSVTERRARLRAIARFQQLTSPVAAKSVEDTAFYRHGRLLSRNEVGADPRQFSLTADEFHAVCADRRARYPRALLATATHDHKRGEDVRARLSVISEAADAWADAVERWRRFNEPLHAALGDGRSAPDAVDEYLLYQMMVGTWPLEASASSDHVERLAAWQLKALREAKRHSSWSAPDADYEEGCRRFLERALDPARRDAPFRESVEGLVEELAPTGAVKGLSQALLRMTCPGIPDLYQGTDLWDLSMVDPDNRRPVDYAARVRTLEDDAATADLLAQGRWRDGAIKQRLIARVLQCRASDPELFALGEYEGLRLEGRLAGQFIAFVRHHRHRCVLVVAPLHVHPHTRRAQDLRLPSQAVLDTAVVLPEALRAGDWYDALERRPLDAAAVEAAGRLSLARVLDPWPVALLRGTGG